MNNQVFSQKLIQAEFKLKRKFCSSIFFLYSCILFLYPGNTGPMNAIRYLMNNQKDVPNLRFHNFVKNSNIVLKNSQLN